MLSDKTLLVRNKEKRIKSFLLLLLVFAMILSVFACTKSEGKKPADTTAPGTTPPGTTEPAETTPEVTTEPDIVITVENDDHGLELKNFNGAKLRIACDIQNVDDEVFADETAINIREQALWVRNEKIKDVYGVKIEPMPINPETVTHQVEVMLENIMSGDDLYDLGMSTAHSSGLLITSGYMVNWLQMKYNDFSKIYWMNDVNDKFSFDDALFTAVGDMCISVLTCTYGLFYNRTKGDQMFNDDGTATITEEIFEKINNMEWTYDYFVELVSDIYTDLDYEAGRSAGDFYGYNSSLHNAVDNWTFVFDIPMIEKVNTSKMLQVVLNTEKTNLMVDKLNHLHWETNGGIGTYTAYEDFFRGNALFSPQVFRDAISYFNSMEDDYSILPFPLWDEEQEKYMTGAQDPYNVLTIPTTCKNLDMVSYIVEILNYESRETLFPVYYEESLKKQVARDLETIEMLNIIMDGRNFDLGTLVHQVAYGLPLMVRDVVAENESFSTIWSAKGPLAEVGIKSLVATYKKNKANK